MQTQYEWCMKMYEQTGNNDYLELANNYKPKEEKPPVDVAAFLVPTEAEATESA